MASLKFTINSDDEISEEEISENEQEDDEAEQSFQFHFDDGTGIQRMNKVKTKKSEENKLKFPNKEIENIGIDVVRDMPHAEERAIRAHEKAKKRSNDVLTEQTEQQGMSEETEAAYFDSIIDDQTGEASNDIMFTQLNLSRSLLRAIESCGYVNPTPIQAQVIPHALAGRDICASAVTGSGKTAAFTLPFLERLLYRPRDVNAIRVLIVTPTRELASQIHSVIVKLSVFTDITSALISGGKKDIRSQETTLRNRPDIVICTPGRIIDHLRNSRSVTLDDLDVLVLDEVDRLLDLGFQEELEEIVKYCPLNRQTMLFSATMTSGVDDLAKLSLKRPIRIKTQGNATTTAPKLTQEFIRLRHDSDREAILSALILRSFTSHVLIFFETKKEAHRFYVLMKVLEPSLAVCELHGDMTQPQRESALYRFMSGQCDIMIATDVAARGLDITTIQTVINAEMPRNISTYIHRVGRTARAGKHGRSITLVSDSRRKIMKDVLKSAENASTSSVNEEGKITGSVNVLSRTIPTAIITHFISKIASLENEITEYIQEEHVRVQTDEALRQVERAENLVNYADEIKSRPARTWYASEGQKKALKEASRERAREEAEAAKEGITVQELTALQKAQKMVEKDMFLDDEEDKKKSDRHRLSRKKRRRLDAMKELEENDNEMKAIAKKKKVGDRETELSKREVTGSDLGKQRKAKSSDSGAKLYRPVFAVGGLDQDLRDWNGAGGGGGKTLKKSLKKDAQEKFTEFDANKRLRKGGKIGHQAFKSKKRFKRRK